MLKLDDLDCFIRCSRSITRKSITFDYFVDVLIFEIISFDFSRCLWRNVLSIYARQEFWINLNLFNGYISDWLLQMKRKLTGHSGRNGKRGIPLKVFLFSEKFPVERPVPFDSPPKLPVFPHRWKALSMFSNFLTIYSFLFPVPRQWL